MAQMVGPVEDGENVYRAVRNHVDHYTIKDGVLRLCSPAFNDPNLQPSVDRAILRPDPASTRLHPDDGIVRLVVSLVRAIGQKAETDDVAQRYETDVVADPIGPNDPLGRKQNDAHALITVTPADKKRFNKVKQALCRLAETDGWVLSPTGSPKDRPLAP